MIPNMPSIGVRFDIGKMNAATHAEDAWKAFWQAVDPAAITGSLLFDGDVAGGVFCIAVQSMDTAALQAVEEAVSASDGCKTISADPMIGKGEEVMKESLSMAGNVDSAGGLYRVLVLLTIRFYVLFCYITTGNVDIFRTYIYVLE